MSETAKSLIAYCQENKRVCPMPQKWNDLYNILPNKKRDGDREPALPLILAAWHDTPALSKMLRLQEHVEWADKHGALEKISTFLKGLGEADWFHLGD